MVTSWVLLQNNFIGLILQGISYGKRHRLTAGFHSKFGPNTQPLTLTGVYCMIFGAYLKIQFKKKDRRISLLLVYALALNFILSTAYFVVNIIAIQLLLRLTFLLVLEGDTLLELLNTLTSATNALYTCIDFISQAILIYRCWMMWRQLSIVVVPIILTLAFLGTSLAALIWDIIASPGYDTATNFLKPAPSWYSSAVVSFFSISLAVNALVTCLMVFKILAVYRDIQGLNTSGERGPHDDPHPLIISIFAESGMLTFVAQLVQIILHKRPAFPLVSGLVVILYGISTTIVLVRIEMGLAPHDSNETPKTVTGVRFVGFESNYDHDEHELPGRYRSEGHLPGVEVRD